jgi:hypothetical protein
MAGGRVCGPMATVARCRWQRVGVRADSGGGALQVVAGSGRACGSTAAVACCRQRWAAGGRVGRRWQRVASSYGRRWWRVASSYGRRWWRAVGSDGRQRGRSAGSDGRQASGSGVGEQRAGGRATGREKIDLAGRCGWAHDLDLSALTSVGPPLTDGS